MNSSVLYRPSVSGWRLSGPFAPYIVPLADRLRRGGYADVTVDMVVDSLLQFGRWMCEHHPRTKRLRGAHLEELEASFLGGRDAAGYRAGGDVRAALGHLRAIMVEQGVITIAIPSGPMMDELREYDQHMRDVHGLRPGTRRGRLHVVEKLLKSKFRRGAIDIARLRPKDVRRFLAVELERVNTVSHAAALASALRDYFRYRSTCGDAVGHLSSVIMSPANWRLTTVPRALSPASIRLVLESFTPELRSPLRGYAIVRLAADLGLRGGEITQLQLEDIDWQAGTLTIQRSKNGRASILPLPKVTGEAIVDYLKNERAKTPNRAVFVRATAPFDVPISADAVRRTIGRAFHRAGLGHGRSHALRHAFACRLVERGSSVKEVADLLRHRSLDTTLIYAKLDQRRLGTVGLPWPGQPS